MSRLVFTSLAGAAALLLSGCATGYGYADGYAPQYPPGYDSGMGSGQYVQQGDLFGGQNVRSTEVFYGPLAQYGSWVDSRFGRAFRPDAPSGWRPYVRGRWGEDRLWLSDDPWGWATDHYGRWGFDNRIGWVWTAGTEWAPSWVAWREADDVTGWAPIPPRVSYSVGIGFGSGFGYDDFNSWYQPSWVWVPRSYLYRPGFGGNVLPWNRGSDYWRSSRWNYGSGWNGGWNGGGNGGWNRPGYDPRTRPGQWNGRPGDGRPGQVDGRPGDGQWNGRPGDGQWNGRPGDGQWNGRPGDGRWNGRPGDGRWNGRPGRDQWNGRPVAGLPDMQRPDGQRPDMQRPDRERPDRERPDGLRPMRPGYGRDGSPGYQPPVGGRYVGADGTTVGTYRQPMTSPAGVPVVVATQAPRAEPRIETPRAEPRIETPRAEPRIETPRAEPRGETRSQPDTERPQWAPRQNPRSTAESNEVPQ